jgi:hypothetical protein
VVSVEARIWSTTPKCIDKRSKNWLDWKVHITPKTKAYDLCSLLFNIIVFVECPIKNWYLGQNNIYTSLGKREFTSLVTV